MNWRDRAGYAGISATAVLALLATGAALRGGGWQPNPDEQRATSLAITAAAAVDDIETAAPLTVRRIGGGLWEIGVETVNRTGVHACWLIPVAIDSAATAAGTPAAVGCPAAADYPHADGQQLDRPDDNPAAQTAVDYLTAFLTGGHAERLARPDATLPAPPAAARTVTIDEVAVTEDGAARYVSVQLTADRRKLGYRVRLEQRDGRWEIVTMRATPDITGALDLKPTTTSSTTTSTTAVAVTSTTATTALKGD